MATVTKKDKFFEVLRNIFVGAKIEGNSGYVNLMKIKSKYYNEFKEQLHTDIDAKLKEVGQNFEEELYNKLFTFFKKYFSESGSIYFSYTPLQEKVYERIYRDDKDVMLFWKTHMLYYVKTERLFKNMEVEDEDILYLFDVAELEHKKSNEKKDLVFDFVKAEHTDKRRIYFSVKYSKNGSKTKTEEILKNIKKEKAFGSMSLRQVEKVFGIFKRQSEVDYFINKDAKGFLKEQFSLWIKGYLLDDETLFEPARLNQLKALQNIAFNIIDLVGQFEDELVKVWNKPKFAHSSNYVITLDKIADKDFALLEKIIKHKGIAEQVKEWQELGMLDSKFEVKDLIKGKKINEKWQYLPLDTKHFKDAETVLLQMFDDLDNDLEGYVIHSDNYQMLNTLRFKFQRRVQVIYTDPPYNTDSSPIIYINNYKHSSWLTLMENRLSVSKHFLTKSGLNITAIDDVELRYLTSLNDSVFGYDNYITTISSLCNPQGRVANKVSKTSEYHIIHANDVTNIDEINVEKIGVSKPTNLKRTGTNSRRTERPNRYYPILIKDSKIEMITEDEFNNIYNKDTKEFNDEYIISLEKKYKELGYDFIIPISKDEEKLVWQRTFKRVSKEKDTYIVDNKSIKTPSFEREIPKTLWQNALFSNPEYGSEYLKHILGHSEFETPKSFYTVLHLISMIESEYVMDYFGGSGTTAQSVIELNKKDDGNRKYIIAEMGDHFFSVIIPRIKKVCFADKWKDGKALNANGYSHFFKYYSLEQYEETLSNIQYEDKGALPTQDIYHQYLFLKDLKLADDVVKLDEKSKSIKVDLTKLHPAIDIPETLSHLTGKFIKQIKENEVVFTDGTSIDLTNIDYKIVKPLIWW